MNGNVSKSLWIWKIEDNSLLIKAVKLNQKWTKKNSNVFKKQMKWQVKV